MRFGMSGILVSLLLLSPLAMADEGVWTHEMQQAQTAQEQDKPDEAYLHYQTALEEAEKEGPATEHVARTLISLGNLFSFRQRRSIPDAEGYYKRALAIRETLKGADSLEVAEVLDPLSSLYETAGRYSEAQPIQERLIAIRSKGLGATDPDVLTEREDLAETLMHQKKYAEAETMLKEILTVEQASENPDVSAGNTLYDLSYVYEEQAKYPEAVNALDRLRQLDESTEGRAVVSARMARLYNLMGKQTEAEALLNVALPVLKNMDGGEMDYSASLLEYGKICMNQGRYSEAEPALKEALAVYDENPAPADDQWTELMSALAEVYRKTAQVPQAEVVEAKLKSYQAESRTLQPNAPHAAK